MRIAALLLCLFSSACMPVVQHGPWVRRGLSGSVGGSFIAVRETDASGAPSPLISFDGGMRLGLTPNDSSTEGASFGVNLPMLSLLALTNAVDENFTPWQLLNFEGYVALPATKNLNASFGLTGSSLHTMPYVQLGKADRWYTTQSVLFISESESWAWVPSFSWVSPRNGYTRTHITLSGGLGSDDNDMYWMAGFSIIFEIARARN